MITPIATIQRSRKMWPITPIANPTIISAT